MKPRCARTALRRSSCSHLTARFGPLIVRPFIHHKFVVIDAETKIADDFHRSANMSGNALCRDGENLLEITECPRLAATYLAGFMRLYEHHRARAGRVRTYTLSRDARWTGKAYKKRTPEWRARVAIAKG